MTTQLENVLAVAKTLSFHEKLELLEAISLDVQHEYPFLQQQAAFWSPRSLDEFVHTPVVYDVRSLAVDIFPDAESADAINQFIAERRHADRMS